MGATLHLKKFTVLAEVPTKLGYGTLFIDIDNRLKLKDGDGTITSFYQSAYDVALENGFIGTVNDWLLSLVGATGSAGLSAYQIWLNLGNTGTETDFLNSLKGLKGDTGSAGSNGLNGNDGLTAYQIWINLGNTGTETDFINSLKGLKGDIGLTGKTAFQEWLDLGNTGTETDFINSLKGLKGDIGLTGKTAFQEWLDLGNTGTAQDFINSLVGATGATGAAGQNGAGVAPGGVAGDVAVKASSTDYDFTYKNFDTEAIRAVGSVTGDLNGFENTTDSLISFDNATRTITIQPATSFYNVWLHGVKYSINTTITYQITDTDGGNYYNLNPLNNTLYNAGSTGGIRDNLLCVYVFWDATNNQAIIFGDERHGYKRDTEWHYNQHRNFGTFWRSGGALTFTLNNDNNNVSVGTPLIIADEDLEHNIIHSASHINIYEQVLEAGSQIPVLYYLNTGYVQTLPSSEPYLKATLAQYNEITNSIGSLVECVNNKYLSYWLVATNDTKYPIKFLLGRQQHDTIESALTETFDSFGLPLPEVVPLYHLILNTNSSYTSASKTQIVNVRKVSDRVSSSGAASSATSHDSLTGRTSADAHPISSITGLETALNAVHSVPTGGTANQVLKKISATNYDYSWQDENGAISIHEADTPPIDTDKYPLWLDTTTARLKIFYTSSNVYIDVLPSTKGDTGAQGVAGVAGSNGNDGLSAYQIWLNAGNSGSQTDFLTSLIGATGSAGLSAYQIWLNLGNSGTAQDFINSLKGDTGSAGSNGLNGNDGNDGLSAYQIWLNLGNSGTQTDFINSLIGSPGSNGSNGNDGLSAYQIWLNLGNSGTQTDFINSLKGDPGVVPSNLDIQSILLANNTGTLTPTANKAFITAIDIANTTTPVLLESNGVMELIQGSLLVKNINYITAIANGTTFTALGLAAPTVTGTATAATLATTSNYTKTPRVEALVTTAAATAVAGYRGAVAGFTLSADATQRGFKFAIDGAPATGLTNATNRFFMGLMSATAAPTDVDPSTITNILGIGYSNADATLQFMYRGAGAVVKLNTGIAKPTADRTALYRLVIVSNDGVTSISVIDLINGTHYQATLLNASLPLNTLLTYKIYSSAGGTSSVTGITISRLYYEYLNVNIA